MIVSAPIVHDHDGLSVVYQHHRLSCRKHKGSAPPADYVEQLTRIGRDYEWSVSFHEADPIYKGPADDHQALRI